MRLTKKHYETFMAEFDQACKDLNIVGWRITKAMTKDPKCHAEISYNSTARIATIALSNKWDLMITPTPKNLRSVARHEALHLLLADISPTKMTKENVRSEEGLVNNLEKLIWKS